MNASAKSESLDAIRLGVERLRGDPSVPPSASIVVPVNAQGDLELVVALVGDLISYDGPHTFEIVLLVNNFPPEGPPPEIEALERLGLRVESVPDVWRRGEAVCFSARMVGIKAAASERVISFDADSRVPNAPSLLDWYMAALACDAADLGIGESRGDVEQGLSGQLCVGVGEDEYLPRGGLPGRRKRAVLARPREWEQANAVAERLDELVGAVGRAIRGDDDVDQPARILERQSVLELLEDDPRLVVCGHDHGDRGERASLRQRSVPRQSPEEHEHGKAGVGKRDPSCRHPECRPQCPLLGAQRSPPSISRMTRKRASSGNVSPA